MKKINLQCPIGYTGYGITSLNILKHLSHKAEVSLFNIGNIGGVNTEQDLQDVQQCIQNAKNFDTQAPTVKIWHQTHLKQRIGNGLYSSFPFFELDRLSPDERNEINYCDKIYTASKWSKQVLLDNDISIPITVCPLGVDRDIFKPQQKIQNNKYIFLHIGKWELRKSQDILLHCFEKAFTVKDDVELWLCPHNPFLTEKEHRYWVNMVKYHRLYDKIKIFSRVKTQYDLANIISQVDCGVFVSRAEGWNNEILEVMGMDKPCIVTNYSAHTEYCDKNNSFLVDVENLEPAFDNKWFFGQGKWAKLGIAEKDCIIHYMKYVYNNNIRSNQAGLETAKNYSWNNTAEIIYQNAYT